MGKLVYDLGNAYQEAGVIQNVASLLYSLHIYSLDNLRGRASLLFPRRVKARRPYSTTICCALSLHASLEFIADCHRAN